jgi:hypothetical protein
MFIANIQMVNVARPASKFAMPLLAPVTSATPIPSLIAFTSL